MRHSLISLRIFTLITFSWCLLVEFLTLPFHIHHSHWYRWSLSWTVISSLSSKPSENMGRTAVCCQVPSQDTLLPSKKSQRRHPYRNVPSVAALVWVSPAIEYFQIWLYLTWNDLPPCRLMQKKKKKNNSILSLLILTVVYLSCGSHVSTLPTSSTWGMLPNQHQLTLTENGPWLEFFSSWASSLLPGPLLPYPVWSGVSLDSPLLPTLLRIRFLLPDSLSSPAYSLKLFYPLLYDFNLDYAPVWLQFGLCYFFLYLHLSLCIF